MARIELLVVVLGVAIAWLIPAPAAHAQSTRTWVSGVGDDANPCTRTAPCKTFPGAFSKTAAGGEISALDPGGFGALTITKAITVNGEGTLAGILSAGTNGIVVSAGANDVVIIRGISINGAGTGLNGIRFLSGAHLRVENTTISRFTGHGIDMAHNGSGQLSVQNVSITNVGTVGVRVTTSTGTPTVSLTNVRIQRAGFGIDVLAGNATIAESIISHVTNQGLVAEGSAIINAERCTLHNNGTGASAFVSTARVRLSRCAIFNNGTGVNVAAGAIVTVFQNNAIFGNTTNVTGTVTSQAQQ
jgi:hypothetical protein